MVHVKAQRPSNSEINKVAHDDRPVHNWYRFVLSFPPHLVREYVEKFDLEEGNHCVLDPFCGTGTTLVECKKLGIASIGIEAHPMAHLASRVKTDWSLDPDALLDHASEVAEITYSELESQGLPDCELPLFDSELSSPISVRTSLKQIPPECEKLLLKNSISPLPLHKTLVLLETLENHPVQTYLHHERLALAKALVSSIGNLQFGPEVGVGPPKKDAPVVSSWLAEMRTMADDLRNVPRKQNTESTVYHADSRQMLDIVAPASVDAVITSPPYPNEKDYTRTTRLESVLLGLIRNKDELRRCKAGLVRSNTRGVYKDDDDDRWVGEHLEIQRIAEEIESRRIELGKTSGFERMYHRVAKLYFGGMARHLSELRSILKPGARLAYVVGDQASYLRVMIRTGELLGNIAESLGYELSGIDLFRTRLATATKEQLREEIVVLNWPGAQAKEIGTRGRTLEHLSVV